MNANPEQKVQMEAEKSTDLEAPSAGSKSSMSDDHESGIEKPRSTLDAKHETSVPDNQLAMDTSDFITGVPLALTLFALIFIMVRASYLASFAPDMLPVLLLDGDDDHLNSHPAHNRRVPITQRYCVHATLQ